MSVKVKDVGNYKIHVKETIIQKLWASVFFIITVAIGIVMESIFISNANPLIPIFGFAIILISLFGIIEKVFSDPAYYVDTTMYGVGGKTIRKTTPAQDYIAICQAAQEFEKEILERIAKEKELGEIVGKCK